MKGRLPAPRYLCVIALLAAFASCGKPPTTPTPTPTATPTPSPTPLNWAISGRVIATLTGEGIGGTRLTSAPATAEAWTDAEGRFSLQGQGAFSNSAVEVAINHPSFVSRIAHVTWATTRDNLAIDLIRDAPPFSFSVYRDMARGLYYNGRLGGILRWSVEPKWYIATVAEDTGQTISSAELAYVTEQIRVGVPAWSGGRFAAPVIEAGTNRGDDRQQGWIVVRFEERPRNNVVLSGNYCGYADVGTGPNATPPGRVMMVRGCMYRGSVLGTITLMHEIGHAMGFHHLPQFGYVMSDKRGSGEPTFPTATERHHAAIAYSRPWGNIDPDIDIPGYGVFRSEPIPKRVSVVCR
jgi:hypothetical protein